MTARGPTAAVSHTLVNALDEPHVSSHFLGASGAERIEATASPEHLQIVRGV